MTSRLQQRRYPDPTASVEERTPSPVLTEGRAPGALHDPQVILTIHLRGARAGTIADTAGAGRAGSCRGVPGTFGRCRGGLGFAAGSKGPPPPTHRRHCSAAVSELSGSRRHTPTLSPPPRRRTPPPLVETPSSARPSPHGPCADWL